MYKLVAVTAKNFMSFKQFQLNVDKPGVWLISGFNEVGGDSNGSGKSSIFSAISWCLYGRTSKGSISDISNWAGGSADVEVTFRGPKGLVSVHRNTTKIEIIHENGEVIGGNKVDVQKAINELFKCDYMMLVNSTLWACGSTEFLAASGDVDKKKLLKAIMGLEVLDKGAEKAKRLYDEAVGEADKLSMDTSRLEARIQELEAAESRYAEKAHLWEVEHKEAVDKLQRIYDTLIPPDSSGAKAQLHEKDSIYQKLTAELPEKERTREQTMSLFSFCVKDVADKEARCDLLKSQIDKIKTGEGGICEYCGSEITRKTLGTHRKELNMELSRAIEAYNVAREGMATIQDRVVALDKWLADYDAFRREIIQLSAQYEIEKGEEKNFAKLKAMAKANLEAELQATNPYINLKPEQSSEVLKGQLKIAQGFKDAIVNRIDYLAYIRWLLSREGVSSYIIEQSFSRLEHLANYYLSKLCTEGFRIQIKPQRELKSKALKEEIDIAVFTGKHNIPYWNLSDGQRQRLNIALLVAVYRLCRDYGQARFDFLLLDEVLDLSIGDKGQEDVLRFMKEMLAEIQSIYIISHKDGISSGFDHEVVVNRDAEGVSKVVSFG